MRFVCFTLLAAGARAQVQVPEDTPVRVRLKASAFPRNGKGVFKLPVAAPLIIDGAVVINRSAEVVTHLAGRSLMVTAERVQSADGGWIDLRPEPLPPTGDEMELEFRTAAPAVVNVEPSLRFEAVDRTREGYLRLGRWALDLNRTWAAALANSGPGMISMVGFFLIGIGLLYRWFDSRRERA